MEYWIDDMYIMMIDLMLLSDSFCSITRVVDRREEGRGKSTAMFKSRVFSLADDAL